MSTKINEWLVIQLFAVDLRLMVNMSEPKLRMPQVKYDSRGFLNRFMLPFLLKDNPFGTFGVDFKRVHIKTESGKLLPLPPLSLIVNGKVVAEYSHFIPENDDTDCQPKLALYLMENYNFRKVDGWLQKAI